MKQISPERIEELARQLEDRHCMLGPLDQEDLLAALGELLERRQQHTKVAA